MLDPYRAKLKLKINQMLGNELMHGKVIRAREEKVLADRLLSNDAYQ